MKNIGQCKFGDIIVAKIPFVDDLTKSKIRPMFVLQKDKDDFLMMKITTKFTNIHNNDVILNVDAINNLESKSLLKINKISVFHKDLIIGKIGELKDKDRQEVKNRLQHFIESL